MRLIQAAEAPADLIVGEGLPISTGLRERLQELSILARQVFPLGQCERKVARLGSPFVRQYERDATAALDQFHHPQPAFDEETVAVVVAGQQNHLVERFRVEKLALFRPSCCAVCGGGEVGSYAIKRRAPSTVALRSPRTLRTNTSGWTRSAPGRSRFWMKCCRSWSPVITPHAAQCGMASSWGTASVQLSESSMNSAFQNAGSNRAGPSKGS